MAEFKVFGEQEEKKEPERKSEGGNKFLNKVKKLVKKKPFLIAVAVVVVLGLLAWYRKAQNPVPASETVDESGLIVPDGLSVMYPEGGFMSQGGSDYMSDEFLSIKDSFSSELGAVQDSFNVVVDSMSAQIEDLSDRIDTQSDTLVIQSNTIARQNDLASMQANSDAWHYATTTEEKKALEQANEEIASKYGWERGDDGVWYDNGKPVYTTVTQANYTSSAPAKKSLSSSSTKTVTKTTSDVDTMKANSQAWHTASDSEKQRLHEENVKIAQKNNWTFDSGSGTYKDSAGNRVY